MRSILPIWCAAAVVALFINLGGYPLFDADEGRNGEVGREMAATNDYVMPRFDALPYVDKPIVYFAAEAAAMEVLGPTETAARLPALLFTLATAALIAWFARRVWNDDDAAWASAIAMLSMPLTIAFSRTVIFDSALTFFMTLALISFWFAIEEAAARDAAGPAGRRPALPAAIAWAAIALGVITKGPVAIAVPLLVAIPYAIKRKRFGALWSWWGLVAFVAIIAPWVWAVQQVVPDFLHYVLVTETAQRLATKALKRTGPPWYFIPYVIGGALPWTIALMRKHRDRDDAWLYLMLWVLIPFVFFSISQSKRPQYVLPVMPALALLVGSSMRDGLKPVPRRPGSSPAAITLIILGAIVLGALPFVKLRGEFVAAGRPTAIALGVVCLVAGLIAFFSKRRDLAFIALSIPTLAIPIIANPLLQAIGDRRSTKSFVAQLRPYVTPDTEIIGVEAYTGSMSFYLQRAINVATPDAEELTSNYLIRHYADFAGASPIKRVEYLAQALADSSHPHLFIVRNNDAAHRAMLEARGQRLVAEGAHFVAYTMRR